MNINPFRQIGWLSSLGRRIKGLFLSIFSPAKSFEKSFNHLRDSQGVYLVSYSHYKQARSHRRLKKFFHLIFSSPAVGFEKLHQSLRDEKGIYLISYANYRAMQRKARAIFGFSVCLVVVAFLSISIYFPSRYRGVQAEGTVDIFPTTFADQGEQNWQNPSGALARELGAKANFSEFNISNSAYQVEIVPASNASRSDAGGQSPNSGVQSEEAPAVIQEPVITNQETGNTNFASVPAVNEVPAANETPSTETPPVVPENPTAETPPADNLASETPALTPAPVPIPESVAPSSEVPASPVPETPSSETPTVLGEGIVKKTLELSGFSLPVDNPVAVDENRINNVKLKFSLAWQGAAGDKLTLEYFYQDAWQPLKEFDLATNQADLVKNDYISFALPLQFNSWNDFKKIKVRLTYEGSDNGQVYLDAVWFSVDYKKEELKTEIETSAPAYFTGDWQNPNGALAKDLTTISAFREFNVKNSAYPVFPTPELQNLENQENTAGEKDGKKNSPTETPVLSTETPNPSSETPPARTSSTTEIPSVQAPAENLMPETPTSSAEVPPAEAPVSLSEIPAPAAEVPAAPASDAASAAEAPTSGAVLGESVVKKVLQFSGFGLPQDLDNLTDVSPVKDINLRLSLGASGQIGDRLVIEYSLQADAWQPLGQVDINQSLSNATRGDYLAYSLSGLELSEIKNLAVRLTYEGADGSHVYLDAVWLEFIKINYEEYKLSEISESDNLIAVGPDGAKIAEAFPDLQMEIKSNEPVVTKADLPGNSLVEKAQIRLAKVLGQETPAADKAEYKLAELETGPKTRKLSDGVSASIDLDKIAITTTYQSGNPEPKNVSLGQEIKSVKQSVVIENKTDQDQNFTLTLKTSILAGEIIWSGDGQKYQVTSQPKVFKAFNKTETVPEFAASIGEGDLVDLNNFKNYTYTHQAGAAVVFEIGDADNRQKAIYDWSGIPTETFPELAVQEIDGLTVLTLTLQIPLTANGSYTIDPSYGLVNASNYNIRYDGAAADDYMPSVNSKAIVIGDVNGDTYSDLVLGASGADNNGVVSGSAYVIFGSSSIGQGDKPLSTTSNYNIRYDGAAAGDNLTALGTISIGDINGDNHPDLLIGTYYADNNGTDSGSVWVMFSTLIDDVTTTGNNKPLSTAGNYNIRYDGAAAGDQLVSNGWGNMIVGDVNGDGYSDLVLGAPYSSSNAGKAYVIYSTLIDDVTTTGNNKPLSTAGNYNIRYDGAAASNKLGEYIATGDINGDGYSDLVLGAYTTSYNGASSGSAYVMYSTLIDDVTTTGNNKVLSTADNYNIRYDGGAVSNLLTSGRDIAIGDVNGDGYSDLVLGASNAANNGSASGSAWVMYSTLIDDVTTTGNNKPLSTAGNYNIRYDGAAASAGLSYDGTILIGDVNGDGYSDLVLGAPNASSNVGSAYVMYSTLIDDVTTTGNNKVLSTAGNYNIRYDGALSNNYLTKNKAMAIGDVNGDGYSDLVLGAPPGGGNGVSSGTIYVMYSTLIDDVTTTGNNKAFSTTSNYSVRYIGAAPNDFLGLSGNIVIGDINSDDHPDLLIGAYYADNNGANSGSVWVVLTPSIAASSPIAIYEGNDAAVSPSSPGTEAAPANFSRIKNDDGFRWQTALSQTDGGYDSQVFKFQPDISGLTTPKFTINWNGYGDPVSGKNIYLNIWNFNSSDWEQLDSDHCATDCALSGYKTGADYKDGSGYVWVWLKGDNELSVPAISNIGSSVAGTAATITWTTDINSDSQIAYDATSHSGGTWSDYAVYNIKSDSVTSHSMSLSGLMSGYTYYYRVKSADADGDVTVSSESNFSTGFSCPFLYAYNGKNYDYILDISANGNLGRRLDRKKWAAQPFYEDPANINSYPFPEDYTWIDGDKMATRTEAGEKFYDLKLTTEIEEIDYMDKLELWAVDHSPQTEIFSDYRSNGQIHTIKKDSPAPYNIVDHTGQNVKSILTKKDNVYWQSSTDSTPSYLDIQLLPPGQPTSPNLKLAITRAKEMNLYRLNIKPLSTDREHLLVKNAADEWVELPEDKGIYQIRRPGAPQSSRNTPNVYGMDTKVIDLSGLDIKNNEVRLLIPDNQRPWDIDWLAVDTTPDEPLQVIKIDPYYADLHQRGISDLELVNPADPRMLLKQPNYNSLLSDHGGFYPLYGQATRYGDVLPLLTTQDDKFDIMVQGDETALRFKAPEQNTEKERDFILYSWIYYKAFELALGDMIAPLPFKDMTRYPYKESEESYPAAKNADYLKKYQTRQISWFGNGLVGNSNPEVSSDEELKTVTIQAGDSLRKIAQRLYSDPSRWEEIYITNQDQIANPDIIIPGQVLKLLHHSLNTDEIDVAVEEGAASNTAPAIGTGPSDGGSSGTAPTNEGAELNFTATASDTESDNYYLAVCTSDSITANNNAAPTCATGEDICVSSSTASGSSATCNVAALPESLPETVAWYAFVCDYNAASACSTPGAQASGDNGSPVYVNHPPAFSSYSNDGPKNPGQTVTWSTTSSDSDTDTASDTVTLYVCSTASFSGGATPACGATKLCNSSASASNATCGYAIPNPKAGGANNAYGYIVDSHGMVSGGASQGTNSAYTVSNVVPSFTAGGENPTSSATTPTDVGDNLVIKATATDTNGDQWKVLICKTAGLTGTACDSGAGDTWCTGNTVNSASESTCTYQVTSSETNQSYDWYAYACDATACSAYSQGAGDSGSPFYVNHPPTFTNISNDGPYDPGATAAFSTIATDGDTSDTLKLYVCASNAFTDGASPHCTNSDEICSTTSAVSTNPGCSASVPDPSLPGSNNYYGFIVDNHGQVSTGQLTEVIINNLTPAVSSVALNGGLDISLNEGTTKDISFTATVTDGNGCTDIDPQVVGSTYRTGIGWANCDDPGKADENDCYPVSCVYDTDTCSDNGIDTTATFTCTATVWFNADPTDSVTPYDAETWKATVDACDVGAYCDTAELSTGVDMLSLLGMSASTDIVYDALAPGQANSGDEVTTLTATGNVALDANFSGGNLTSGGNTIGPTYQKYSFTAAVPYASMAYILSDTPTERQTNMSKTIDHTSPSSMNIYWKLMLPSTQAGGSYSGVNAVTAVKGDLGDW